MLLTFCLNLPAILLGGSKGFFSAPNLIIYTLMPISLSIASAVMPDFVYDLRVIGCLLVPSRDTDLTVRNTQVLKHMVSYTYPAGIIGMMIGWTQMLRQFKDLSVLALGFLPHFQDTCSTIFRRNLLY